MTFVEFCYLVKALSKIHRLSVTSWGRTKSYNVKVGGHPESWHLDWLAVDLVPDGTLDATLFKVQAESFGFDVVLEADHIHLEPAGPRTSQPAPS